MTDTAITSPHLRSDIRSRSLDLLRYPLALVVLTAHLCGGHDGPMEYIPWLSRATAAFISGQSVPIYFFIAGYVFFFNTELTHEVYLHKLKNRFHSLLIPYILWNLLAYIVGSLAYGDGFADAQSFIDGLGKALLGSTGGDVSYPADIVMWFVRALIVMALISPLINWFLRHTSVWGLLVLGILWAYPRTRLISSWQLTTAIFFFSWGAWMSLNKRDMIAEFKRLRILSLIIYLATATTCYISYNIYPPVYTVSKTFCIVAGLFLAYNVASYCVAKGHLSCISRIAPAAFFLYCSHMIFLRPIGDLIYMFLHPHNAILAVAYYVLIGVLTAVIATGLFFAMRRYAPRVLAPFVGGRL